jgi:hypothetical protein
MVYRVRWGNKYGAKRQEYGGKQYHSKKEAGYAAELDLRVLAKDIKGWTRQKRIPLEVNGFHVADYYIDFVVEHNDDTIEYVEVKGFETPEWRLKWKLFEALYSRQPTVRLTVVK